MIKIKLNLRNVLADALGKEKARTPATFDVSEFLDFNNLITCERNLNDLLFENRLIAHIWSVEDVQFVRPDLNAKEAWAVLKQLGKDLDSSRGITWDTLNEAATDLFGKPRERDA
jgi:hypothetical protein